jgi:8-oxo-dGTP pyrophosphatase MutT (NUDIX family)
MDLQSGLLEYLRTHPNEEKIVQLFLKELESGDRCFKRDQLPNHFTASGLVLSMDKSKVLLNHHKKLNLWMQFGGHADGETNLFEVAKKEVREESGLTEIISLNQTDKKIIHLDCHQIPSNKNTPEHYHLDVRFVFFTSQTDFIISEESHDIRWVKINDIGNYSKENSFLTYIKRAIALK